MTKQTNSSSIIWRYAALEHDVQSLINQQCKGYCSNCPTSCCCRTDICEEAFESALLRRLHQQDRTSLDFSDQNGWLDDQGCSLALGRPPVCYEYFCDEFLQSLESKKHVYVLKTLGKLLFHCGGDALNGKHLISLQTDEELEQVNVASFCERVNEAKSALVHIRYFFEVGDFEFGGPHQLSKIIDPPGTL